MVILAWNGGSPGDIFDGVVFKKILSFFITAAVLKLTQGTLITSVIFQVQYAGSFSLDIMAVSCDVF